MEEGAHIVYWTLKAVCHDEKRKVYTLRKKTTHENMEKIGVLGLKSTIFMIFSSKIPLNFPIPLDLPRQNKI